MFIPHITCKKVYCHIYHSHLSQVDEVYELHPLFANTFSANFERSLSCELLKLALVDLPEMCTIVGKAAMIVAVENNVMKYAHSTATHHVIIMYTICTPSQASLH